MTDGPGEFWKNDKTDLLLAFDPEAEKVSWGDFIEDFKMSFEPLDTALEAQLKLRDLKMKDRADKYTYQFLYLAKQTGYNNAVQIVAFKRGLLKSLKEDVAIKQISEIDRKEYMAKGLCFRCRRGGHQIRDCLDALKKEERKKEEPRKLTKEEWFAKIKALVNDQTEEEKNILIDLIENEAKMDCNSMHIPLQYKVGEQIIEMQALLDSGAGGQFISTALARRLGKRWVQLPEKIKVFNVDRTLNKTTWISHVVELEFKIAGKEFRENFMISGIEDEEMILGLLWLHHHNPQIDWETGEMKFVLRWKLQIKRFKGILNNTLEEVLIGAKITALQELAHQQQEAKKDIDELIPFYLQGYRDCFEKGRAE
ncbi:protease [Moniliophthora roreri MCA 2997]|uniref:Protease n=1 Tax=Moniliophthora roreri (strain MCA 2997) TaxID=1381753 RepID=V2WDH6_MONRO|nr:protease [Moniliophthora roreri MCA 2997]